RGVFPGRRVDGVGDGGRFVGFRVVVVPCCRVVVSGCGLRGRPVDLVVVSLWPLGLLRHGKPSTSALCCLLTRQLSVPPVTSRYSAAGQDREFTNSSGLCLLSVDE